MIKFPAKNLYHSEGTRLCDYTFQPKTYPILRGSDNVITLSSKNPILRGPDDMIMFPAKNLYHSEGT